MKTMTAKLTGPKIEIEGVMYQSHYTSGVSYGYQIVAGYTYPQGRDQGLMDGASLTVEVEHAYAHPLSGVRPLAGWAHDYCADMVCALDWQGEPQHITVGLVEYKS